MVAGWVPTKNLNVRGRMIDDESGMFFSATRGGRLISMKIVSFIIVLLGLFVAGCVGMRCGDPGVSCSKWQMDYLLSKGFLKPCPDGTYSHGNDQCHTDQSSQWLDHTRLSSTKQLILPTPSEKRGESPPQTGTYNQEKSQHLKSNQKQPGCVGQTLIACIDFIFSVGDHFSYERRLVEDQLKSSDRTDINGKRISGAGSISVGTYSIQYNSSRIVSSVRMMKFYIIDNAETFDEYSKTGLYDMLRIAIGDSCPDEETVYKFFQNSVKPKIKKGGALSEGYSKFYHSSTDPIQLNGYLLKYQRSHGRDINDVTYDNRSGQFKTSSITVAAKRSDL